MVHCCIKFMPFSYVFQSPILTNRPVISNSVTLQFRHAVGKVLLVYPTKQGFPSCTCHRDLLVNDLLVSIYKMNLPVDMGK